MRFVKSVPVLAGIGGALGDGVIAPKDLDIKSACESHSLLKTPNDMILTASRLGPQCGSYHCT